MIRVRRSLQSSNHAFISLNSSNNFRGFTIVELLVVIVVIGILAAVVIVAYNGLTRKAIGASLQSDLVNGSKKIKLFYVDRDIYPNDIDDCPIPSADNLCLTPSLGNEYTYTHDNSENPPTFELISTNTNTDTSYLITESSGPVVYDLTNRYEIISSSSSNPNLNRFPFQENLVRDSYGGIHVAYNVLGATSFTSYYSYSNDSGSTWSAPLAIYTTTNISRVDFQPDLKIDSNNRLHFTVPEYSADYIRVKHMIKNYGQNWGAVTTVGLVHSTDEVAYVPTPDLDSNNNLQLVFDRSHNRGVGLKSWNGSWSATTGVLAAAYDFGWQKTLSVGSNLYMFFIKSSDLRLYMVKRENNIWSMSTNLTTFTSDNYDVIVDSDGDIWLFVTDIASSPYKTYYRKYDTTVGTWGQLTIFDSDTIYHTAFPSATVDNSGNIYVFYGISNSQWQIYYKVYNKAAATWSERNQFTNSAEHGSAFRPLVRYQTHHQVDKDIIELTYRQNDIGSSTYNLYYGELVDK